MLAGYNWQEELTLNPNINNNYNLPGGAYGSIETNSFSLDGYSSADKPSLLFNYWLDTEADTQSGAQFREMRDSARVFVSLDGGDNWEVIATNNSDRTLARDTELPSFVSVSEEIVDTDSIQNQHVQELYDTDEDGDTGSTWRQARVDLGRYHGESDIRLRFDFSTAGELDENQTDAEGNLINQIAGPAGTSGKFIDESRTAPDNARERAADNNHGGFYFDDIIVTTTERGEMVGGAEVGNTDFIDLDTPVINGVSPQQLQGPYQLEIRRGTEYMLESTNGDFPIFRVFGTNESLTQANPVGNADPFANEYGPYLGDSNIIRQQGQFLIQNNIIQDASTYAISIDAARDSTTGAPTSGVTMNRRVLNNAELVPGVVVSNNIVSNSGTAGILFSGDSNTGNVPEAAVPYGRLVNNTVYGGTNAATGIEVTENAAPTLLNNVFALLSTGVDVDGTSSSGTVIGASAFHAVGTEVNGATQDFGITLTSDPFVNAAAGNFYPNRGAGANRLVDSAMGSLQDRPEFTVVTEDILIPQSPIIAPERDIFGQLRADDADVAGEPGLGTDVFVDRGAVERVDEVKPRASLVSPQDQSTTPPIDQSNETDVVRLVDDDAKNIFEFRIQLSDVGIGFDKTTVSKSAVTLSMNNILLEEGEDYIYQYSKNLNQIILKSARVYSLGVYEIFLTSNEADAAAGVAASLTDLAGNPLLSNGNGAVKFVIELEDVPEAVIGVEATLQYQAGTDDASVNLEWQLPAAITSPAITEFDIQTRKVGEDTWLDYATVPYSALSNPQSAPINSHNGSPFEIGTSYVFRVRAVNDAVSVDRTAPWSRQSTSVTPLRLPTAPKSLSVSADFKRLDITWAIPDDDGDNDVDGDGVYESTDAARILNYVVEYSTDTTATPTPNWTWTQYSPDPGGNATSLQINDLLGGAGYHVRVGAVNERGLGAFATSDPTSPAEPTSEPGVVRSLSIIATAPGQLGLTWIEPTFDGGSSIDDYILQTNNGQGWEAFSDSVSNATAQTITTHNNLALVVGSTLQARVKAKNADSYEGAFVETTAITVGGLPGIITNESFAVGDEQITLSWTAPTDGANTGYYPITSYTIERYDAPTTTWGPETTIPSTSATILGLINGDSYLFRVSVNTGIGTGSTVEIGPATPEALPGKPEIQTVTPGDKSLVVVWTPPADTGGKTIFDYDIQYQVTDGNGWTQYDVNNVSTQTTETISGLINQTSYNVQVRAVTDVGPGQWSDIATTTPVGPPESPTGIEFVVDGQSGTLTSLNWVASARNSPVTDEITYQVQYRTSSSNPWIDINDSNGIDQTIGLSELAISTSYGYEFQLQASTDLGASDAVIVEPFENLVITSSDAKISLDWDDLQNAVSDYTVQYRIAGNSLWTFVPFEPVSNTSEAQIQQLINGTEYDIRITSVPATTAQPVSIVIETVMPAGLPQMTSAPRWTDLLVASGSAAIEWNAASSNGADVTNYIIEYTTDNVIFTPIGDEGVSTQTSATLTGLPTSVPLAIRVKAVNRIGTGSPSPLSTTQTLPGAPSIPSSLAASANDTGGIALTWTAPSTSGGLPLDGYFVEYKTVSGDTWLSWLPDGGDISTTSTSATVTGLVRNVNEPYVFRVTAKNSDYNSAPSTLSNQVVPYAAPVAITLIATPSDQSMQLSWEVPVDHDNGGLEVTGYQVEGRITGSDTWSVITNANATSRSITVLSLNGTRLENNVSHDFRVAAVNGATPLNYQAVTQSPMGTAAAPTNLQASSGSSSVTLSWQAPSDNGGGDITDYEIQYRVQNEDNPQAWIDASDVALSSTSSRVPGLTLGTRYEFQVAAVNAAGTGTFTQSNSITVGPVGAAPQDVEAWKEPNGNVQVMWDRVTIPAGVTFQHYEIQYRDVNSPDWSSSLTTSLLTRMISHGHFDNNTTYQFRVAMVTNTGRGAWGYSNNLLSY